MRRATTAAGVALLGAGLAACADDTGLHTTPTFSAARYVPTVQQPDPPSGPAPESRQETVRGLTGVKAISAANRESTVEPDDASMRGATWYIEDVQPSMIYRVCTSTGRVTTILLPPGERFNGAVGGNVDAFLINVAYAGPRPAVSILPRRGGPRPRPQPRHPRRILLVPAVDLPRGPHPRGGVAPHRARRRGVGAAAAG